MRKTILIILVLACLALFVIGCQPRGEAGRYLWGDSYPTRFGDMTERAEMPFPGEQLVPLPPTGIPVEAPVEPLLEEFGLAVVLYEIADKVDKAEERSVGVFDAIGERIAEAGQKAGVPPRCKWIYEATTAKCWCPRGEVNLDRTSISGGYISRTENPRRVGFTFGRHGMRASQLNVCDSIEITFIPPKETKIATQITCPNGPKDCPNAAVAAALQPSAPSQTQSEQAAASQIICTGGTSAVCQASWSQMSPPSPVCEY